jgi:hypothetical protein
MSNEGTKSPTPRKSQNRRDLDSGPSIGQPDRRVVVERRELHGDANSRHEWLTGKALLGSYQHTIDKSFLEIFGSI